MAQDEVAEGVGGIFVSIGASHARLPSDLEAADRVIQNFFAGGRAVTIRAQVVTTGGATGSTAVRAIQQETQHIEQAIAVQGQRVRAARRKNITARDIGTAADPNRVYTFDPAVYAEQERQQEAKAARQREVLLAQHARRTTVQPGPTARQVADEEQRQRERDLRELSYEKEAAGGNAPTSVTFAAGGRTRTPAEIAAFRQQSAAAANAQAATRPVVVSRPVPPVTPVQPIDAIERGRRELLGQLGTGRGGIGTGGRGLSDEDFQRRAEQRIAAAESSRVAAGRTPRTTAAGFGGQFLFGGPARQQVEAAAQQAAAEQNLLRVRRLLTDPKIIRDARAYRSAIQEQAVAENTLAKATERVQSLSGGGTALRSLAAVTVAGAGFGLALKAIDVGLSAVGQALGPVLERSANYADISAQITGALADQARANQNNVGLTVKLAAAQSGLSTGSQAIITPLIQQRVEAEAGNKAFANLVDNLKAYQAIRQQNANLPPGVDAQLFKDVTGVGGTGIGGVASTIELLTNQIKQAPPTAPEVANLPTPHTQAEAIRQSAARGLSPDQLAINAQVLQQNFKVFNEQLRAAGDTQQQFVENSSQGVEALKNSLLPGARELGLVLEQRKEGVTGVAGNADIVRLIQSLTKSVVQPAAQLQAQFNAQRFAVVNNIGRQQQLAANVTLPAQQALANLQNPLQPTGTGIVAANATEQRKINAGLKEANDLQAQLNAGYAQGRQILEDTYKPAIVANFGQAAGQAFDTALSAVEATGKQIAAIQAGISNEQAAYQTAQYNFQLLIAKRNLSDIGGLVGKNFGAGESYLGVLERQNLALSRQGQLLQFELSQRQINFQVAQAGFQAPGLTAEERAANVAEAKLEASYAQKQLDIQKQTFKNQVKIVDIGNLRQGYDLARQIGLLLQGRAVSIDTQLAEKKLQRLSILQQQQVAKVGTYITEVDNLFTAALSEIGQLEAAAGHALEQGAKDAITAIYGFYTGLTNMFNGGGAGGGGGGGAPGKYPTASGGVFQTQGPTALGSDRIMGEAGSETLLVLSHPRTAGMIGGGGGGNTLNVNFYGDIHTASSGDLSKITRAVMDAINAKAARLGLRSMASSLG